MCLSSTHVSFGDHCWWNTKLLYARSVSDSNEYCVLWQMDREVCVSFCGFASRNFWALPVRKHTQHSGKRTYGRFSASIITAARDNAWPHENTTIGFSGVASAYSSVGRTKGPQQGGQAQGKQRQLYCGRLSSGAKSTQTPDIEKLVQTALIRLSAWCV